MRAGALHCDLAAAAQRIYLDLVDGDLTAWADAEGVIWFVQADDEPVGVDGGIVGTYRMGASASDILDDLVELRRSRSTDAIIY
ncbi:hypothetical protein [Dokdonella sp.]|uniref:hypothetical protein n=1 Tax=Dokdonella sp. TaxID=2291710 RepID=UPI0037836734